ncbi:MAG: hypothetical protein JEY99_10610 [Spirochaetales bacterium]|nr:hypothetical protein [Spirochaetales bacterium]
MKKVLMINGSPKRSKSSTGEYIHLIQKLLPSDWVYETIEIGRYKKGDLLPAFNEYSIMVFAFPLYVDAAPGILTAWMEAVEKKARVSNPDLNVWGLLQCGFYEGTQNGPALDIIGNFCRRMGFIWQGGAGIGTGAMIQAVKDAPLEAGIRKSVTSLLKNMVHEMVGVMADSMSLEKEAPAIGFTQYSFPWFLYRMGGQMGWNKEARKNGLKRRELYARPYLV